MKMRLAGVAVAMLLTCKPASAEIVALSYTGIVVGSLTNASTSLVGDTYYATYLFDTSKGLYWSHPPTANYIDVYGGSQYQSQSPLILEAFTINNQTQFLSSPGYGELILCSVCVGANSGLLEVGAASTHMTNLLYARSNPVQFPPSLDISVLFGVISNIPVNQGSKGEFLPDNLDLLPQTVDVAVLAPTPIPATFVLFATGLSALGLLRLARNAKGLREQPNRRMRI